MIQSMSLYVLPRRHCLHYIHFHRSSYALKPQIQEMKVFWLIKDCEIFGTISLLLTQKMHKKEKKFHFFPTITSLNLFTNFWLDYNFFSFWNFLCKIFYFFIVIIFIVLAFGWLPTFTYFIDFSISTSHQSINFHNMVTLFIDSNENCFYFQFQQSSPFILYYIKYVPDKKNSLQAMQTNWTNFEKLIQELA